jgi:hypothetical protein
MVSWYGAHVIIIIIISSSSSSISIKTIQWVPGLSRGLSGRGMALTTHPHLAPRLKNE